MGNGKALNSDSDFPLHLCSVYCHLALPLFSCLVLCHLAFPALASAAEWHGVFHDAPLAVALKAEQPSYRVGDTFRIRVTATNSSDRPVLVRRDWREQVVCYHINPTTGEQIEWPGRINTATWLDSSDVVRLKPGASYSVLTPKHIFGEDDVATFEFRVKLCGVKDFARKYDTWQGQAWSNAIKVTVAR